MMTYRKRMVGMADAVQQGVLRLGTRPFGTSALELELLRIVDAAIASRKPLGIVLPLHTPDTPIVLGATSIVGSVLQQRGLGVRVAVAAKNVSNATYEGLFLRDVRLADFVSRARIRADGTVKLLKQAAHVQGRLYLTGELERLTDVWSELDAVIVDQSAAGESVPAMLDWPARSIVYLTRSPLDPNLAYLRDQGGLLWGMQLCEAQTSSRPSLMVPADVLTASASCSITISAPDATTPLDTALAGLWRALGSLLGVRGDDKHDSPVRSRAIALMIRWAWSMYHVAATNPTDSERYDRMVRASPWTPTSRLGDASNVAREFARSAKGAQREDWHQVAHAFADVTGCPNVKQRLLRDWVRDRAAASEAAVVVVRNQAMVAAVSSALSESTEIPDRWDQLVQVVTPAQLPAATVDRPLQLCLTGSLPRTLAGIFAAPPGGELTAIAAGPVEASRIQRAVAAARAARAELRRETIEVTAPALGLEPLADDCRDDLPIVLAHQASPDDPTDANPWEPFSAGADGMVLRLLAEVTEDARSAPAVDSGTAGDDAGLTTALSIHLDGQVLLLAPNDLVARRRDRHLSKVAAKAIAAGDTLLLVDRCARLDLLDAVISRLSETPAYTALSSLIGFWHQRLAVARGTDLTYGEILRRMDGTTITSESTIGAWIRGDVGGPANKSDIERVALAIGDDELARAAAQVGWALTTIHRVHRQLGRWLAAQIDGATVAPADATVDAALGVHVADLLEAVTSWQVTAVETDRFDVPRVLLGQLMSPSDLDEPLIHRRSG